MTRILPPLQLRCARTSVGIATFSALVGVLVLLGWAGNVEMLKRVEPGFTAMNPATALGFVMTGLALIWLGHGPAVADNARIKTTIARILAVLVLTIGLIEIVSYRWGVLVAVLRFGPEANQMAPTTAAEFCLLGLALLLLDITIRKEHRPSEWLAMAIALISLVALFGYACSVQAMYTLPGFIPMALHTAIVSFLLAIGILCARPDRGIMGLATSDGMGGLLLRRLFPMMVVALFLMGWLRLEGERLGLYGTEFGVALFTSITILIFGTLIGWAAGVFHRMETERAFVEAGREKALTFNRMIMDNSLDVICVFDAESRFVEVSKASLSLWGYAPSELKGRTYVELVHPDDLARTEAVAGSILSGQPTVDFSNRYVCKDGHAIDVDWSAIWSEADGLMFCVARDATRRKLAEERLRQSEQRARELNATLASKAEELQQTNHELESFTYSVSHDLRAPLRHIDGYARMLSEDAGDRLDGPLRRYLDAIGASARQMGTLIDDLLAFSRMGRKPIEKTAVDMAELAEGALREIGDRRAASVVRTEGPLPSASADPVLLRQVWVNLLSNALKYSAKRGDGAQIEISGESDGDVARYRVRDNGVGFDMRYVDKLFGIFQRLHTQEEFEGTGVGLAIVQRIVSRHGGRVWAEGETDRGATFTFELPSHPLRLAGSSA